MAEAQGPESVFAYLETLEESERREKLYGFLMAYAKIDPEFIAKKFSELRLDEVSEKLILKEIIKNWKPASMAVEWATSNLTGSMLAVAFIEGIRSLYGEEKQLAMNFADSLPPGKLRDSVFKSLYDIWASEDYKSLLAAVPKIIGDKNRMNAVSSIVPHWVAEDFNAVESYLNDEHLDVGLRENITRQAGLALASTNPKQALDWISNRPVFDSKVVLDAQILSGWMAKDLKGVLEFVENSDDVERKETFAIEFSKIDPESAANWMLKNSDNHSEDSALYSILFGWGLKDSVAAQAWVSDLGANSNGTPYQKFIDNIVNRKFGNLSIGQSEAIQRYDVQSGVLPPQQPRVHRHGDTIHTH